MSEIVVRVRETLVTRRPLLDADGKQAKQRRRRGTCPQPSRTLRGKKNGSNAPHLTFGSFDPQLIRPVNWLAVPVYLRVSFAGSFGTSDLLRQRAPSVGAPGVILWPHRYRVNTSRG